MNRAIRRHRRERQIQRVERFGELYRESAHKLYSHRTFCTCVVSGCGNPRRLLRGSKQNSSPSRSVGKQIPAIRPGVKPQLMGQRAEELWGCSTRSEKR